MNEQNKTFKVTFYKCTTSYLHRGSLTLISKEYFKEKHLDTHYYATDIVDKSKKGVLVS